MPPSRHSSSSHSSHSHSSSHHSSSHSSSRSHSSSSHSSRSHSSSSYGGHSSSSHTSRPVNNTNNNRIHIPKSAPSYVKDNSLHLRCKNHKYIYYSCDWTDESTGKSYFKGYYDENGKHYNADEIVFKNKDGSYKAHFTCAYCGNEAEYNWTEGEYPKCGNCGAIMDKEPAYIDEIIEINKATVASNYESSSAASGVGRAIVIFLAIIFGFQFLMGIAIMMIVVVVMVVSNNSTTSDYNKSVNEYSTNSQTSNYSTYKTNVDIYDTDLYLDLIDEDKNIYEICTSSDDYEKHLTYDFGFESYYDRDSDCYIWYNTDVSPNLWQYWYDSVAGDNEYGWMECENGSWFIENSFSNWDAYNGDTSNLWHIRNEFDQ